MNCPTCKAAASEGSAFCEDCGSALAAVATAAAAPAGDGHDNHVSHVSNSSNRAKPDAKLRCPGCGAGPTAIDADGFCTQCGNRRVAPARDHMEDAVNSRCAGVSDIGCKHDENQDYFVLAAGDRGELVAVVCDGVSRSQQAMAGSKVSCEAAVASIRAEMSAAEADPDGVLVHALGAAQHAICRVPFTPGVVDDGEPVPPAQATAVGVLVVARRITVGWLGDSRAYWVNHKKARQLTTDHSWVNDVVESGEMTEAEARKDARARAIVRSLGADGDGRDQPIEPEALTLNVTEAGVLLVVSDGFYTYADDAKIAALVHAQGDADALTLARHLVTHARDAGGSDNITVVAIRF